VRNEFSLVTGQPPLSWPFLKSHHKLLFSRKYAIMTGRSVYNTRETDIEGIIT